MKMDLISLVENQMSGFSKGQKRVANVLLNSYDKAAYMTASKLGEAAGVSESTVVRFAIELGYDGYPELQRALQDLIRTKLTSSQRIEVTNHRIGDGDILESVLLSDAEKIRNTLSNISHDAFNTAVDAIIGAENIYIIGVRSSSSLASFMNFYLSMIFDNVHFVQTTSGSEMFERIINLKKDDVMIGISFPRYSTRIINAVDYAKDVGATVVALTDSMQSPIAAKADAVLIAESDMASFVDSLVAPLSIINAIIVAISKKKQKEITAKFDLLERIWDDYDVYEKNNRS